MSKRKETNRKATFSIKGTQKDSSGEESVVELITEGEVVFKKDCVLLTYDEGELSGLEGHRTSLELRENSVSMERTGEYGVTMRFERESSIYRATIRRSEPSPYRCLATASITMWAKRAARSGLDTSSTWTGRRALRTPSASTSG
jgi:hypothetical protein